jgi:hypothetical protein
MMTDQCNYCNG